MKKNLLLALLLLAAIFLNAQDSLNMTRLGRWDDDSLPIAFSYNLQYNGCWGLALDGREYAVLGGAAHILFFDVTQPTQPQLIGKFGSTTNSTLWREFKSYKNRIYAVADASSDGLMIFDMSQAPDTVIRTYWSNEFFNSAHTITLDTTSGRIYLNGSDVANLLVLDISQNPDKPVFVTAATLAGGYIHDSYVRNDTIYASSGNDGYYVFDFTDPLNPDTLGQVGTGGYNHNSWLNSEGTYAYYTEEIPDGQPIRIVDLQGLGTTGLEIAGGFLDSFLTGSLIKPISHNVYIKDHLLFNSQYEDGLLVYDISNPTQPALVGRYDTHPENTEYNRYYGCWGNYPWLPSGTIIAGDMQNGLQLLKFTTSSTKTPESNLKTDIFPNPTSDALTIRLPNAPSEWSYRLLNPSGQVLQTGFSADFSQQNLSLKNLPDGLYFIEIQTTEGKKTVQKVVKGQ